MSDRAGYRLLWMPEHPMASAHGYSPEHRLIMSVKLGRLLVPEDLVHHISGDRLDNRPENLELISASDHAHRHRDQERSRRGWGRWGQCQDCGETQRRHAAHGLCLRCYGRIKQREYTAQRRLKG